jgi:twitching motility protein PilJ
MKDFESRGAGAASMTPPTYRESNGISLATAFLLVFIVAMLGVFAYADQLDGYDRRMSSLLGEGRVLAQRLSADAIRVTADKQADAFDNLQDTRARMEQLFSTLTSGEPGAGIPPAGAELQGPLRAVKQLWDEKFDGNLGTILAHRDDVNEVRKNVREVTELAGQLAAMSDQVATLMASRRGESEQVYVASRQLMLSERFVNNVSRILEGGKGAVTAADRFGRDAALFGQVVDGLLNGNSELGIKRINDADARAKLEKVDSVYSTVRGHVSAILRLSPEMFMVTEAVYEIAGASETLVQRLGDLEEAHLAAVSSRSGAVIGSLFGAGALVLLFVVLARVLRISPRLTGTAMSKGNS